MAIKHFFIECHSVFRTAFAVITLFFIECHSFHRVSVFFKAEPKNIRQFFRLGENVLGRPKIFVGEFSVFFENHEKKRMTNQK